MTYKLIHFAGVSTVEYGSILGHDAFFRPYEILDIEHRDDMTDVHLQPATADSLKRHMAAREHQVSEYTRIHNLFMGSA